MKTPKTTSNLLLPFRIDPKPANDTLTAFGGLPIVAQTFRSLGLPQSVAKHLHLKQRQRGFDEATLCGKLHVAECGGWRLPGRFSEVSLRPGSSDAALSSVAFARYGA